jgi:hypothetical protein
MIAGPITALFVVPTVFTVLISKYKTRQFVRFFWLVVTKCRIRGFLNAPDAIAQEKYLKGLPKYRIAVEECNISPQSPPSNNVAKSLPSSDAALPGAAAPPGQIITPATPTEKPNGASTASPQNEASAITSPDEGPPARTLRRISTSLKEMQLDSAQQSVHHEPSERRATSASTSAQQRNNSVLSTQSGPAPNTPVRQVPSPVGPPRSSPPEPIGNNYTFPGPSTPRRGSVQSASVSPTTGTAAKRWSSPPVMSANDRSQSVSGVLANRPSQATTAVMSQSMGAQATAGQRTGSEPKRGSNATSGHTNVSQSDEEEKPRMYLQCPEGKPLSGSDGVFSPTSDSP